MREGESDPVTLVAAIRNGDAQAEEALVRTYGRAVAIILDRHTNSRPEAEDLFQDTFCTALQKLRRGELREPVKLPGFLSQIARYLALEYYRKRTRRRTDTDSEALDRAVAGHQSPLAELLTHERAAIARRLLAELSVQRDRDILHRFYIAEEDKDRIAADLGLSGGQFNRVLHRARERYRQLYLQHSAELPQQRGRRARGSAIVALVITLVTVWCSGHCVPLVEVLGRILGSKA